MVVTKGYVQRAILRTHTKPGGLVPIGPDQDPDTNPVVSAFTEVEASVAEVQDHLRGQTDAKVRSRAVSIRRAYLQLEEKGLAERSHRDGNRQYWRLTDAGLEEAEKLYQRYTDELADLRKRYGGDWAALSPTNG